MCKIKSQDSLKTDLLTLPCKCVYTHRRKLRKNKKKVLNVVLILDRRWRAKKTPKLSSKYLVHGNGAKLVSNWKQNMLNNKS